MIPTCAILIWATIAPSQSEPSLPRLQFNTGDSMIYTGEVLEESTRLDVPYRRKLALEVHLFVLGTREHATDLAVMTLLQPLQDPNVAGPATIVTGRDPGKQHSPPAVRLALVRVSDTGQAALLLPIPKPPLSLTADTTTRALPTIPLTTPATLELGFLVPGPEKTDSAKTWSISTPGQPPHEWSVKQTAVLNGAEVLEVAGRQQTAKWENPTGLDKNWRQTDSVWVGRSDGLARQFSRVIERKDGIHVVETRTVKCTLTTPPAPNRGESYSAIRKEIEQAITFAAELEAGQVHRLVDRIDAFERHHRETPFRRALEAIRRQVEK